MVTEKLYFGTFSFVWPIDSEKVCFFCCFLLLSKGEAFKKKHTKICCRKEILMAIVWLLISLIQSTQLLDWRERSVVFCGGVLWSDPQVWHTMGFIEQHYCVVSSVLLHGRTHSDLFSTHFMVTTWLLWWVVERVSSSSEQDKRAHSLPLRRV